MLDLFLALVFALFLIGLISIVYVFAMFSFGRKMLEEAERADNERKEENKNYVGNIRKL